MAKKNYIYNIDCTDPGSDCYPGKCLEVINAKCVSYNGFFLKNLEISDGDDLEYILMLIDNAIGTLRDLEVSDDILAQVGSGATIIKEKDDYGVYYLRTFVGESGIVVTENTNEIEVKINEAWLKQFILQNDPTDLADIVNRINSLEQQVTTILGRLGVVESTISDIQTSIGAMSSLIGNLQTIVTNHSIQIQSVKNDIEILQGIHFEAIGTKLVLKDGAGYTLSTIDLCPIIVGCDSGTVPTHEYVFNVSATNVDFGKTTTPEVIQVTSTKDNVATPWEVQSKPSWITVTEKQQGSFKITPTVF